MKLNKLSFIAIVGALALIITPQLVQSEGANTISFNSQVTAAVKAKSGPNSHVNVSNVSADRVTGGHPGEKGFYKAYDVNTAKGKVAIHRDKNGIYWHFGGKATTSNAKAKITGSGSLTWGLPGNKNTSAKDRSNNDDGQKMTPSVDRYIGGVNRAPGAPEPSTAILYGLGLLFGGNYFRRRRKQ
jgi:hypothetical protein